MATSEAQEIKKQETLVSWNFVGETDGFKILQGLQHTYVKFLKEKF